MPAVHRFNFRFFYENGKLLHTKYPVELKETNLDEIDYAIIKELAKNARISLIDLAKITKTETNVVKYRIRKLRNEKIIGTHVLEIDFEKLGLQHFQINFSLKNHSMLESMISYASQDDRATFATVTLGRYDLALEFAVETMKDLRSILNNIKEKFSESIVDHDIFILYEHSVNGFHWN